LSNSSTQPILEFSDVSFSYLIPAAQVTSFKEAVHQIFKGKVFMKFKALEKISFSVHKGERLAIIGRNGSGKTTLLRLICGIAEPEEGKAIIRGRIAPVLSLGAGLEPELTGLENVRLLGAFMDLTQVEEETLLADVMSFSELDLSTLKLQVKRYSSGMMSRLSFAVAMARKADILVVDEALAVGDVAFQKKCHAVIEKFCVDGGTLIFVSHSLEEVRKLCRRVIVLNEGHLIFDGQTPDALKIYENMLGM